MLEGSEDTLILPMDGIYATLQRRVGCHPFLMHPMRDQARKLIQEVPEAVEAVHGFDQFLRNMR
ncbi:hypothetical protein D3C72_2293860 [compost metagenome]